MIHLAEKLNEERIYQLYRFGTCYVRARRYQCIGRSTNSLEICLSDIHLKQNTQFEASKKGLFDKEGVEEVENLHSKTRVILIRGAPDRD